MKKSKTKRIVAYLLCIVVILIGMYSAIILRYPNKYLTEIKNASSEFGVELELIQAVVWTESKYDRFAVSSVGAVGLMQLMPSTADWCTQLLNEKEITKEELFDPLTNIRLGTFYLSYLLKRFDESDAIAAYNAGQGTVQKWLQNGTTPYPYKETLDYVNRVNFAREIYKIFR